MADRFTADPTKLDLAGWKNVSEEEMKKHITPRGKMGLPEAVMPPLLDQRRHEYFIPDIAFRSMPASDTVHIWQLDLQEDQEYSKGGLIVRPESTRSRDLHESGRGILVAAGPLAMDHIVSHGMGLGHIVRVLRFAPWCLTLGFIANNWVDRLLVMHSGDVKSSEDTMTELRNGTLTLKLAEEVVNGVTVQRHVYYRNGEQLTPVQPWQPEEV